MKKNTKKESAKKGSGMFLQLTGKQAAGWAGAFCFATVWIFILGVLVGRGTAPVEFDIHALQNELAELREKVLKKEQVVLYDQMEKLSNEEDVFDFHDNLKKSKVNYRLDIKKEKKDIVANIPAGAEEDRVIPAKTRLSGLKRKTAVAEAYSRPEPKPATVSKPKPAAPKPAVNDAAGTHTIQVAALRNQKDADALVSKLKDQGFPAYKVVGKISETNVWYRVRVGMFSSEAESRITLNKLRKQYKGALLVSR